MKRIAILAALLLTAAPAHAQLDIVSAPNDSTQFYTLSTAWNWLHLRGDVWHLVMKTDNVTDDYIWIKLGDNLENAVTSILQLEDVIKKMEDGACFRVSDKDGEGVFVTNYRPLVKKQGLTVQGEHRVGTAYLNTGSVTRAKVILLTERNSRYQKYKATEAATPPSD